ncbi:MAG: phosphatase PAP2 family protein [bacterium]|nr:phosphatase PAP2 family protein [bacterium]
MNHIYEYGIDIIKFFQQLQSPVLTNIFKIITELGSETFYIVLFPFILWSINFKKGVKLGIVFLLSVILNEILKALLGEPRPFELVSGLNLIEEHGFGIPSGHSQSAIVIWGIISTWTDKRIGKFLCFLMIFLISFSRIYLGVHFPTDILGGWLVGGIILYVYSKYSSQVSNWLDGLQMNIQLGIVLLFTIIISITFPVKNPVGLNGLLAGFGIGLAIMYQYYSFQFEQKIVKQTLRFIVGIVIVFPVYFLIRKIVPVETSCFYFLLVYLNKMIVGFIIIFVVSFIFKLLHLIKLENIK